MNRRIKKKIQKRITKSKQKATNKSRSWWWLRDPWSLMQSATVNPYKIHNCECLSMPNLLIQNNYLLERRNKVKIDIYKAKWDGEKIVAVNIGYIELDKFDKDKCWDLCNWSCHSENKPENLHSKISACCSDVAFYDPETSEYHVPDSFGWFSPVDSLDKVVEHWNNDFYTPSSAKGLYNHLKETGKTFEEIYMEDK